MNNYINDLTIKLEEELNELIYPVNTKKEINKVLKEFKLKYGIIAIGKFTLRYWTSRGWSENDAKVLVKKNKRNQDNLSSPMTIKFWLNKINENTGIFYTEEEAKDKIKSFRKLDTMYWISKGYSNEDAIKMVSDFQIENSKKFITKLKNNPENYTNRTSTQLNYWLSKGYSIEDAKINLKNRQCTSSLEFQLKKYGEEEGLKRYININEKKSFSKSKDFFIEKFGYDEGIKLYFEYNAKKNPSYTSKESLLFFIPIYKQLRYLGIEKTDIYWGIKGSREYFLNDDNSLFFYDFTIPKLNKIIEYNGIKFHANKNWDKERLNNWKCLYSNISAQEKINLDEYKNKIANANNFDVLEVWSDNLPSVEEILNFLLNK